MPPRVLIALTVLLPLFTSCKVTEHPISVSSDPSGARVLVNGADSGFHTPCLMSLEREDTWIEVELEGYVTAARFLTPGLVHGTLYWREMSAEYRTWDLFLWLNRDDFLTPYKRDKSLMPNRIHVQLKRQADALSYRE